MRKADVEGARQYAKSYLDHIRPRWEELAGRDAPLKYSVELLRERMCIPVTAEGTEVSYFPAVWLVRSAATCPYAYQLYEELRALGGQLRGSGADTIRSASVKKPNAQGNRDQNGARDLILSVMWAELQNYGLPNENKVRKGVRPITPSIGAVISEAIQSVIGLTIEPRAIMASVFDRQKN
jgi:hypothetical protein